MTPRAKRDMSKVISYHEAWNQAVLGGILWKRIIVAIAACVMLVTSTVMLWFAFVEHEALYTPLTPSGLRVLVFVVIGFYVLHASIHVLTDRRDDE